MKNYRLCNEKSKEKSHKYYPLVSIITVVYNGDKYLEQTINSVINQSYNNIEYIIIDGGSTDNTLNIISKYKDRIDYIISEPDKGIYDAMNKGIELSHGEIIGIVNSDDWYEPNTVQLVINAYNDGADGVIYGLLRELKNNQERRIHTTNYNFLYERIIPHQVCFISHQIYKKLGCYDLNYKYASDYDLLLRLYNKHISFYQVNAILSNSRLGGATSVHIFDAKSETLNILYKHGCISKTSLTKSMILIKIRAMINILQKMLSS